jgi:two-component system sensor histidine kinase BaeS
MPKNIYARFLLPMIAVVLIGLSASFLLRELMLKDFREYLEGEMEDRASWIAASLESSFHKKRGWEREDAVQSLIWGFMMGMDLRLYDTEGRPVLDTETALESLSAPAKKRVLALRELRVEGTKYTPYPLFLEGLEIGRLDVRWSAPRKRALFIERSGVFLVGSIFVLGGFAIILSALFSKKLTAPIKELTRVAGRYSEGDLKARAPFAGEDEIGKLSLTFNQMAHHLMLQEELRRKLTANTAHELRTPLSAIRAELEGILDGFIPLQKDSMQSLYAETTRLRSILDAMEELSHAEASAITLVRQRFELGPFLKNIAERFKGIFNEKKVRLEMESEAGLSIEADPDRLSQILINLLTNALKATPQEGVVRINAYKKEAQIFIQVSDTGKGIKKEDLPYIFERFYKAEKGGLGIGLTIVRELAEAHGGSITAESEPGNGSVFTLILPA